jgi:hypothetical protein
LQPSEPAAPQKQNETPDQKQKNESDRKSQPERQQNFVSEGQRDVLLATEHSPSVEPAARSMA